MNQDQKNGIITAVALLQLASNFPDVIETLNEEFGKGFGDKVLGAIDEVLAGSPSAEEQAVAVQVAFVTEMKRALDKIDG